MTCAWSELLAVLPLWMRSDIDKLGSEQLWEIRLRLNTYPELKLRGQSCWLDRAVSKEDLHYTINAASKYSPWSASSVSQGYITVNGGHRIGLCGESVWRQGEVTGFREYSSICIRIARDFPGIAAGLESVEKSILIIGPPGWGKTTLLRDLIRQRSSVETVCVVDERSELFPNGFDRGKRTDVLTGCSKEKGISMLMRTMGPSYIAVDEITVAEDAEAILHAANCGVRLLATAHAFSAYDFQRRSVYRRLIENHVFEVALILKQDQSYTMERMDEWVSGGLVRS